MKSSTPTPARRKTRKNPFEDFSREWWSPLAQKLVKHFYVFESYSGLDHAYASWKVTMDDMPAIVKTVANATEGLLQEFASLPDLPPKGSDTSSDRWECIYDACKDAHDGLCAVRILYEAFVAANWAALGPDNWKPFEEVHAEAILRMEQPVYRKPECRKHDDLWTYFRKHKDSYIEAHRERCKAYSKKFFAKNWRKLKTQAEWWQNRPPPEKWSRKIWDLLISSETEFTEELRGQLIVRANKAKASALAEKAKRSQRYLKRKEAKTQLKLAEAQVASMLDAVSSEPDGGMISEIPGNPSSSKKPNSTLTLSSCSDDTTRIPESQTQIMQNDSNSSDDTRILELWDSYLMHEDETVSSELVA
jgi:hypothetical protein